MNCTMANSTLYNPYMDAPKMINILLKLLLKLKPNPKQMPTRSMYTVARGLPVPNLKQKPNPKPKLPQYPSPMLKLNFNPKDHNHQKRRLTKERPNRELYHWIP